MLTSQQVFDFARDGFLLLPGVLPASDLGWFEKDFRDLQALGFEPAEEYDICSQLASFLRIVANPRISEIVRQLMPDAGPLYCFTNRCLAQRPGDERRTYGWHQETFYTIPYARFLQTWAPMFEPSTIENGTIRVCVGSHTSGIAPQMWIDQRDRATQIIVDPQEVAKYEQRDIEMRVGDLLVFDRRLFHRSGVNSSPRTRYSLVGMYHDTAAPNFRGPKPEIQFRGITPRQYFDRLFAKC